MFLVQGLAAQIEVAVLEADFLGVVGLAEHRQRQLGGFRQQCHRHHLHFDLAGGQFGDFTAGRPCARRLADDALGAQAIDGLEARRAGAQHQLRQAIVVAQVDKDQPAVIALAVNPTRDANGLAGIGGAKRAAGVVR